MLLNACTTLRGEYVSTRRNRSLGRRERGPGGRSANGSEGSLRRNSSARAARCATSPAGPLPGRILLRPNGSGRRSPARAVVFPESACQGRPAPHTCVSGWRWRRYGRSADTATVDESHRTPAQNTDTNIVVAVGTPCSSAGPWRVTLAWSRYNTHNTSRGWITSVRPRRRYLATTVIRAKGCSPRVVGRAIDAMVGIDVIDRTA